VKTPGRIAENALIDAIDVAIAAYRARHGRSPVNVSHWDPSPAFSAQLKRLLPITRGEDLVAYRYSYMVPHKQQIARKLGFDNDAVASLVTENGSMSIVAIANWLVAQGIRAVRLLCPAYFVTGYSLRRVGIEVNELHLQRMEGRYRWPDHLVMASDEALWITNPVYNTGSYSLDDQAAHVAALADQGTVIVLDEALALTPTSFARACGGKRRFIGLYTPHKAVCLNSFKFSVLVFHPEFDDFFDDWADVLFGGLSASALAATAHFVSTAYEAYHDEFTSLVEHARTWHTQVVVTHAQEIQTDVDSKGHFLSVYFPNLDPELGASVPFIADAIEQTGAAFIPGLRSGFSRDIGFCFRINLAQDSPQFRGAVMRLYNYLTR
jgi:histidinol-phosphate/aromatic aminotransferase/cobyric acid decarboxylase-like protein